MARGYKRAPSGRTASLLKDMAEGKSKRLPRGLMDAIDLKQIRCFAAAYEEGTFSMAAKREYCTQPGLSVYIRRLEEMVGHRLFDRKARGVTPTIAGRHFYACCMDILKAVRSAKEQMLDMSGSVASKIDIGISPSVAKGVLPSVLSDYIATHPFVDICLSEAYSATLTEWVSSGEVQAAIGTKPPAHLGLETTHFFRERLVLVRRANGGQRQRMQPPRERHARELERMKLILPSPKHNLRQLVDSSVRLGASASGKVLEIDGLLATFEVVRHSDWATVMPSIAVMEEVKKGDLVAEPIAEPELWLDYNLMRTKDTILPTACQQFLDLLKGKLEQFSQSPKVSRSSLEVSDGSVHSTPPSVDGRLNLFRAQPSTSTDPGNP